MDLTEHLDRLHTLTQEQCYPQMYPESALEAVGVVEDIIALLRDRQHVSVLLARREGVSWSLLGDALGLTRQGAQQAHAPTPAAAADESGSGQQLELV